MKADKNLVLNDAQINQKIRRMACEIYENNFKENSIVLAGIEGQGYLLAQILSEELARISPIIPKVVKVSLDKSIMAIPNGRANASTSLSIDFMSLGRSSDNKFRKGTLPKTLRTVLVTKASKRIDAPCSLAGLTV